MAGLTVVGLGPGSRAYVTEAAERAINQADVLVGGRRHLDMYKHLAVDKYPVTADMAPLIDIIKAHVAAGKHVVVLASGDPGFYGILATLKRRLPGLRPEVVPGVSSFQLGCARLGIAWEDACLTSCHGRDPAVLVAAVKKHAKVITLTDPHNTPPALARVLLDGAIGDLTVHVACNLSYPDETLTTTTLKQLAAEEKWISSNCIMVIINEN
ncbi:MAG: hypothetical protein VR67_16030 [Peptococcaceae bacterium BRH_c8a]|nr:MAG: hypothetical protein VR67_16030 [Peptococcaceae bacterium BRH_c8a]